jgi:MFS family permease
LFAEFVDILGNLSGVISGVLAFAFSHLDGAHGLSGWQWLFLVEAIITIAFGIALYWILPDCMPASLIVYTSND